MTVHGSCLCGSVRFRFEQAVGPFEICHCNRCRKLTGGQGLPALMVLSEGYELTQGRAFVSVYEAPLLYRPPAYHAFFCSNCGSPLPDPKPAGDKLEIPAGLLDDDPGLLPDKHIFVEFVPVWDQISDDRPQFDYKKLIRERFGQDVPEDFVLRTHYDDDPQEGT